MRSGAFRIAALYIVAGILWITLSDKLLLALRTQLDLNFLLFISSIKGVGYVLLTGLMLYQLIRLHTRRLYESEQLYRGYFEHNPTPMWIIDRRTLLFTAVNDAAVANYGYAREEFLHMSVLDIRPPDAARQSIEVFRSLKPGINEVGLLRHVKKDGTEIDVNITSHVISTGNTNEVMAMAKDVTEVRRLEQERNDYLARLEDTLNSISDAFLRWTVTGTFYRPIPCSNRFPVLK